MSLNAIFIAGNQVSSCTQEMTLQRNKSQVSCRALGMWAGVEEVDIHRG